MAAAVRAPVAGLRLTLRVCLPFLAGYFLSYVYRAVNAVLGPQLANEFSLSAADLGLLTGAYFFACGLFQVPLGLLLDRFGPRRTDALLLLAAAAGAALFVSAHSFAAERIGTMIAVAYSAGAVGAMTVSVPFEYALRLTDWRTIFCVFCRRDNRHKRAALYRGARASFRTRDRIPRSAMARPCHNRA